MVPGDKACLLAAGHVCEILVEPCTDSRGTLLDAIDNLHVQYGKSDLPKPWRKPQWFWLAPGTEPNPISASCC